MVRRIVNAFCCGVGGWTICEIGVHIDGDGSLDGGLLKKRAGIFGTSVLVLFLL